MTNREKKVIEKANATWLKGKNKTKNSTKHPWKSKITP